MCTCTYVYIYKYTIYTIYDYIDPINPSYISTSICLGPYDVPNYSKSPTSNPWKENTMKEKLENILSQS